MSIATRYQKISTTTFLDSYKHGVYIFVADSCQFCKDYLDNISFLDSSFLRVVEVVTQEEREAISKVINRIGFPMTAGFWDESLKFVKGGSLYGKDVTEVKTFLEDFPQDPIPPEREIALKESRARKYVFAVYIFPPRYDSKTREVYLKELCLDQNEIGVDADNFYGSTGDPKLDAEILYRSLKRIVVFDLFKTKEYSPTATELLALYGAGLKHEDKELITDRG